MKKKRAPFRCAICWKGYGSMLCINGGDGPFVHRKCLETRPDKAKAKGLGYLLKGKTQSRNSG